MRTGPTAVLYSPAHLLSAVSWWTAASCCDVAQGTMGGGWRYPGLRLQLHVQGSERHFVDQGVSVLVIGHHDDAYLLFREHIHLAVEQACRASVMRNRASPCGVLAE